MLAAIGGLSLILVQLAGIPEGCPNPWQTFSATQVISGDSVVAQGIGPINRDAYARMSLATGSQEALNAYFRATLGVGC